MHKRVHQAIYRSQNIVLPPKPIAPPSSPKVASSTTSETYANDVESNDSVSKSNSDLWDVLLDTYVLDLIYFIAGRNNAL